MYLSLFFVFSDPPASDIYTLSLHDALPIYADPVADLLGDREVREKMFARGGKIRRLRHERQSAKRSEEHTSELQSRGHLVCRLLLEKKNHNRARNARHRQSQRQDESRRLCD